MAVSITFSPKHTFFLAIDDHLNVRLLEWTPFEGLLVAAAWQTFLLALLTCWL